MEAANTVGRANCSPERNARINEVARAVLVMTILIPAAKHRVAMARFSLNYVASMVATRKCEGYGQELTETNYERIHTGIHLKFNEASGRPHMR